MPIRTVRDLMTRDPHCCTPQDPISAAARKMVECDCGAIPVVENFQNRRLVGIITDRDIVCRLVAKEINPLEKQVTDACSTSVATVEPDTSVHECVQKMERHRVRRIPVVDHSGCVVGIVAQADLARASQQEQSLEHELAEMVEEVSVAAA